MKPRWGFLLLLIVSCSTKAIAQCSLPAPLPLRITNVGSCQMTVSWDSVAGASAYSVQYKLSLDLAWTVIPNVPGSVTSYTITGLVSNVQYKIRVAGVCSNQIIGHFRQTSKKTTTCSTPANVTVSGINLNSATLSWMPLCGTSTFKLKYKLHSTLHWTVISNIHVPYYNFSGLAGQTTYDVQVQANCSLVNSPYSPLLSFTTTAVESHPKGLNVLLILLDDCRQDPFAPDGGPSFFQNPNISRIANEGVRFRLCFPAESQCAPSRASIYTGLYPHKVGVFNNNSTPNITATTLAQILHNNNYYVGLVGKYDLSDEKQSGYDYWMENTSSTYMNATWTVDATQKTISGHKTDVATDSAIGFLHKVPADKSFYLEVGFAAPHVPYVPRPGDDTLYMHDTMPLPENGEAYVQNFPSCIYPCDSEKANTTTAIREFYQMLAGVEYSVGRILNELTAMNTLDSTLIIFTSDNGYMLGDHSLDGKRLAYEESLRLPLYMRCPPTITGGTVIENEMASLLDLPPTILDYLGITTTTSFDGISLKKIIDGTEHRNEFFNEFFSYDCTPDIRCIRSLDHKYIEYGCSNVTEEFFDLVADPNENVNLINNSAYDSLVEVYRNKLAYWENYYQYYTPDTLNNCQLANPVYSRSEESNEDRSSLLEVHPNPVSDFLNVNFYSTQNHPYHLQLFNTLYQSFYDECGSNASFKTELDTRSFPPGNYLLVLQDGDQIFERKVLIQH